MGVTSVAAASRARTPSGCAVQTAVSPEEPVTIVPYDESWPAGFASERELVENRIRPWTTGDIKHVGSTAVPGLPAKPIIDIMVGVPELEAARVCFEPLATIGYLYFPYRPQVFHWFCKPSPARRTHHLVLMEPSHPEWAERLAFRDYLRAHPATARQYAALKRRLAAEFHLDREAYTDGKEQFVKSVSARALEWKTATGRARSM